MQISLSLNLIIPRAKVIKSEILSQMYVYVYHEITAYFARLGTRTP